MVRSRGRRAIRVVARAHGLDLSAHGGRVVAPSLATSTPRDELGPQVAHRRLVVREPVRRNDTSARELAKSARLNAE